MIGPLSTCIDMNKLGHKLEEIRVRSLNNVISKLDLGLIQEDDLATRRELLGKLLEWFNFETCPEKERVLKLILRLLKASNGKCLPSHVNIQYVLPMFTKLQGDVEPTLHILIDEIKNLLIGGPEIVDFNSALRDESRVGSVATPIEVFLEEQSSEEQLEQPSNPTYQENAGYFPSRQNVSSALLQNCFPHLLLPWQPLVATDRHVLAAVEQSLSNLTDPGLVHHTCQFFNEVMLQDFPSEIFLQRPCIVKIFLDILENNPPGSNTQLCMAMINCLYKLTAAIHIRVQYYIDPGFANLKQEMCTESSRTPSYLSALSGLTIDSRDYVNSHNMTPEDMEKQCHVQDYDSGATIEPRETENITITVPVVNLSYQHNAPSEVGDFTESDTEDSVLMQLQQLSLPQFGLLTLYQAISHKAMPLAFNLVKLISVCIAPSMWLCNDTMAVEIAKNASQVLNLLGERLEQQMRIHSSSEEHRLVHLQLLALCQKLLKHLVPVEQGNLLIPKKLKNTMIATLLDYPLLCLHPQLHKDLLSYGKTFTGRCHREFLQCYIDVVTICKSMASSVKFLKDIDKLEGNEVLRLIEESLPSLTFHKNVELVKRYLEICVKKMHRWLLNESARDKATRVFLILLSHSDMDVKLETYAGCHKYVVAILGVDSVQKSGEACQLAFLFNSTILTEITCHGVTSADNKIRQYSCEIMTYLLKGKVHMSIALWQSFLESAIPVLPLLQCFAEKSSVLGRAVTGMLDPDVGIAISLPVVEILTGNLRLLFSMDDIIREEAVSRLTWLLTREEKSHEKLPDLSVLTGYTLGQICIVDRSLDLTRPRKLQSYYHVDSLCQVVDLLVTDGVEPRVRRSALTQISVMLEDTELHIPFLEKGGMEIVLSIFQKALIEKEFHNYPDSVIPIVSILRNLCLHSSKIRQELFQQSSVYYCILRALFLFVSDDKLRHDAAQLLCLLLFCNFVLSVPELPELKENKSILHPLSLPEVIVKHMKLPFMCHTHWRTSHYTQPTLRGVLNNDACRGMLRLCWTSEWSGGLLQILDSQDVKFNEDIMFKFSPELKATQMDLDCLKASAISYCCKQYLYNIQNGTTHEAVSASIKRMTGYMLLDLLLDGNTTADSKDSWKDLSWEGTLTRFLGTSPVCPEDESLLLELLQFLHLCAKILTPADVVKPQWRWISDILKDFSQPLPNLLRMNVGIASKDICREVLLLCQQCSSLEIQGIELGKIKCVTGSWVHIVETITQNLKFSDTQHFYNLAFLDWMLTCLSHLTSYSGWSKASTNQSRLLGELTSCLTELITAFHCSKGGKTGTRLASFMGISITRSAILCMNHVLCEMQNVCGKKGWESLWVSSLNNGDSLQVPDLSWLASLWLSRDPVVRAAALQLVAGFCCTYCGSKLMIQGLRLKAASIWEVAFGFLLDHGEASVVRGQAAIVLTNLSSHLSTNSRGESSLTLGPIVAEQVAESDVQALISLLDESNLFEEVGILTSRLYVGTTVVPGGYVPTERWTAESLSGHQLNPDTNLQPDQFVLVYNQGQGDEPSSITGSTDATEGADHYILTTPSLIRAVCWLLISLLTLNPQCVLLNINKFGIVRILFRSISGVPKEVNDSQSLLLYMDVLEMYTGVCSVLSKCVALDDECHSTALRTHDCLYTLLTLLDPALYHIHLPQLMFLRNRLWSQVFRLLSAVLNGHCGYQAVIEALFNYGPGPFLATLETSISGNLSSDLWNSALSSLTSLLSQEARSKTVLDEIQTSPRTGTDNLPKTSLQSVLDECPVQQPQPTASGAQLCALLLHLYDVQCLPSGSGDGRRHFTGCKGVIIAALTSLLAVSREAKRFALDQGLLETIMIRLRELHVQLCIQPVENLHRILNKKKASPVVQEVGLIFSLLTNFLYDASAVKTAATGAGMADLLHKLWVWCSSVPSLLTNILRLLCTFTTGEIPACQSLVLTSTVPGVGLRKSPSSISLLHEVVSLVLAESEILNKPQNSLILPLAFHLLKNASHAQECRVVLCKGTLFSGLCQLHPSSTKKQKFWEEVQLMWLDFLVEFTYYPEGQLGVPKVADAVDIFIVLSGSQKFATRKMALAILRNIAFQHLNRPRLLASRAFLQLLSQTLSKGSLEEKSMIAEMVWALVANNQKAKLVVKSSGIAEKLKEALNHCNIMNREAEKQERTEIFKYVLNIIHTHVKRTKKK